jgi:CBS-domain-containing membrane protein
MGWVSLAPSQRWSWGWCGLFNSLLVTSVVAASDAVPAIPISEGPDLDASAVSLFAVPPSPAAVTHAC